MKSLSWVGAAVLMGACGVAPVDQLRSGTPTSDTVQLRTPGSSAGSAASASTALSVASPFHAGVTDVQGQTSGLYTATRDVTGFVNLLTFSVLDLVKNITQQTPTTVGANSAVWGPSTDPLSANTFRLTVTQTAPHVFTYALEGKAKTAADSAYVTVLSGVHDPALDAAGKNVEGFGSGNFTVDWDALHTLPQNDGNTGKGQFTYSRADATHPATVDVQFINFLGKTDAAPVNFSYHYDATPGSGGTFDFTTFKDVDQKGALEKLILHSRWTQLGAGRSDVTAEGGDLAQPAHVSECWDSNFLSQFQYVSWDSAQDYGNEAAACGAFTSAVYPQG